MIKKIEISKIVRWNNISIILKSILYMRISISKICTWSKRDFIFHEYELILIKIDFDILDTPKIMILIQQILIYNWASQRSINLTLERVYVKVFEFYFTSHITWNSKIFETLCSLTTLYRALGRQQKHRDTVKSDCTSLAS